MKKLLIIIVVVTAIALCLAGCGKKYSVSTDIDYCSEDKDSANMPWLKFNDNGTYWLQDNINVSRLLSGTYEIDGNIVKLTGEKGLFYHYLEFKIIDDNTLEFIAKNSTEFSVTSLENVTKVLEDGTRLSVANPLTE